MKTLLLFLAAAYLLSGCATAPKSAPIICSHPAVYGGAPFPLPENANFYRDSIEFEVDATHTVRLIGAVCVQVQEHS